MQEQSETSENRRKSAKAIGVLSVAHFDDLPVAISRWRRRLGFPVIIGIRQRGREQKGLEET